MFKRKEKQQLTQELLTKKLKQQDPDQFQIYQQQAQDLNSLLSDLNRHKNNEQKKQNLLHKLQSQKHSLLKTPLQQIQNNTTTPTQSGLTSLQNSNNTNINNNNSQENNIYQQQNYDLDSANSANKLMMQVEGIQQQQTFQKQNQIEEYLGQIYQLEQVIDYQNTFIKDLNSILETQSTDYNEQINYITQLLENTEKKNLELSQVEQNVQKELENLQIQSEQNHQQQLKAMQDLQNEEQERQNLAQKSTKTDTRITDLEEEIQELEDEIKMYKAQTLQDQAASLKAQYEIRQHQELEKSLKNQIESLILQKKEQNNKLQQLKGNIRVYCRIRPFVPQDPEDQKAHNSIITVPNDSNLVLQLPINLQKKDNYYREHKFHFEQIFDTLSSQEDLFNEFQQLIESFIDGFDVCLFAYGQTGSGKTYTLEGKEEGYEGILPRSISYLFQHLENLKKFGWEHKVMIHFSEIYMEQHRDLIINKEMNTKNDSQIWIDIEQPSDFYKFHKIAKENRKTSSTSANDQSSRSHSIFQLNLEGNNVQTKKSTNSTLTLVDLAGSERLNDSRAEGQQLEETKFINRSLTALGDVITAKIKKQKHIPFRNSKLTHVLSPCFSSESKVVMLLNLSPCAASYQLSLQSLRFGDKVSSIIVEQKTKAVNQQQNQQQQMQNQQEKQQQNIQAVQEYMQKQQQNNNNTQTQQQQQQSTQEQWQQYYAYQQQYQQQYSQYYQTYYQQIQQQQVQQPQQPQQQQNVLQDLKLNQQNQQEEQQQKDTQPTISFQNNFNINNNKE